MVSPSSCLRTTRKGAGDSAPIYRSCIPAINHCVGISASPSYGLFTHPTRARSGRASDHSDALSAFRGPVMAAIPFDRLADAGFETGSVSGSVPRRERGRGLIPRPDEPLQEFAIRDGGRLPSQPRPEGSGGESGSHRGTWYVRQGLSPYQRAAAAETLPMGRNEREGTGCPPPPTQK